MSSPIRTGFVVIHQNPVIAVIEIAWRWTFGLISTILLWLGARAFVSNSKLSEGDEQALRGHDPMILASALLHILQQPGVLQSLCSIIAAVAGPSAIIWIAAASLGRTATLKKLIPGFINARAVLGFNIARTVLLFAAVIGWVVWMVLCSVATISPGETFNVLYLLLSLVALPVIAISWGLLNWLFSLAPVLASRAEGTAWSVFTDTVSIVRARRRAFTAVTTWVGLPRLAAMVIAFAIAVVVLIATNSVLVGTVVIAIISLVYCAFADYLYVVRLAAYAEIARELPIATAATPL